MLALRLLGLLGPCDHLVTRPLIEVHMSVINPAVFAHPTETKAARRCFFPITVFSPLSPKYSAPSLDELVYRTMTSLCSRLKVEVELFWQACVSTVRS